MSLIVCAGLREGCAWDDATTIKHRHAEILVTYSEDPRRVDDNEVPCELGFVLCDELPCGALGEDLRGDVDRDGPRGGALTRHRSDGSFVPARLVVLTRSRIYLAHRAQRGGEDDPLHARAELERGV